MAVLREPESAEPEPEEGMATGSADRPAARPRPGIIVVGSGEMVPVMIGSEAAPRTGGTGDDWDDWDEVRLEAPAIPGGTGRRLGRARAECDGRGRGPRCDDSCRRGAAAREGGARPRRAEIETTAEVATLADDATPAVTTAPGDGTPDRCDGGPDRAPRRQVCHAGEGGTKPRRRPSPGPRRRSRRSPRPTRRRRQRPRRRGRRPRPRSPLPRRPPPRPRLRRRRRPPTAPAKAR